MELISVVVPVYNVEKYLERCLNSLIEQTHHNLEIILVNDGSTDCSSTICEEFKKQDSRIKVIHKENEGLSAARNDGIEVATGKYIGFVDSDDFVTRDMFEYLYHAIESTASDVSSIKAKVVGMGSSYNEEDLIPEKKKGEVDFKVLYTKEKILESYLVEGEYSCCVNLYKRELFETTRFPKGQLNEDIVTVFNIFSTAKRVAKSNKVCYFYCDNQGSITSSRFKMKDYDLKEASNQLYLLALKENSSIIRYLAEVKMRRSDFSLLCKMAMYGVDSSVNKKEEVNKLMKELRKNYIFLIKSPMELNRKVIMSIIYINYYFFELILKVYKGFRRVR